MAVPAAADRHLEVTQSEIPFHLADIDEDDISAVVDVLRSGWLTTGPVARAFEEEFAARLGGGVEAIAVNSCTAALHLALEAAHVRAGDIVLTSVYTFTATAEVVRYLGAHPVFADVDPATGNLTPASVTDAYNRLSPREQARVKALVPVHFAGLACDLAALEEMAQGYGWSLVDDAAHALPATSHGVAVGRWGDATAFSFYATKTLCTGEGGMVVTARKDLARRMRVMRLHGISTDVFDRYRGVDTWRYDVVAPGFKYNLSDIAAAMGVTQLRRLDQMHRRRVDIAAFYDEHLRDVDGVDIPAAPADGELHARHLYPLRISAGAEVRDQLVRELGGCGIGSSVHFIPLHLHPYYRRTTGHRPDDFPVALRVYPRVVSLPIYPSMSDDDVADVVDAVRAVVTRYRRRGALAGVTVAPALAGRA